MDYKSILVYLPHGEWHPEFLEGAIHLARAHKAHLTLCYCISPAAMPAAVGGRGASFSFLSHMREAYQNAAKQNEAKAHALLNDFDLSWSWIAKEGNHLEILTQQSFNVDLVYVNHLEDDSPESEAFNNVCNHLPLVSGSPVLSHPMQVKPIEVGKRIVIAWKQTREALRAVRYAMPFLQKAKEVHLITCMEEKVDEDALHTMAKYLGLHGVNARTEFCSKGGDGIGEMILSYAEKVDADMLVMGFYGHSRLREIIWGGATRHVLAHSHLPLFMAH